MESMIDQVAKTLGLDPEGVRKANLYQKGQVECIYHTDYLGIPYTP